MVTALMCNMVGLQWVPNLLKTDIRIAKEQSKWSKGSAESTSEISNLMSFLAVCAVTSQATNLLWQD